MGLLIEIRRGQNAQPVLSPACWPLIEHSKYWLLLILKFIDSLAVIIA